METAAPERRTPVVWGARYGDPLDCPPTDEEAALMSELGLTCETDPLLTKAARHHAETLLDSPGALSDGRMAHLRFTVLQLGGTDYGLDPLVVRLSAGGLERLEAAAAQRGPRWSHCGLGVAGQGAEGVAVLVGVRRTVNISPFSNAGAPPVRLRLSVRSTVVPGGEVSFYVGRPDTTVDMIAPVGYTDGAVFEVTISDVGKHELEVLHDTGHGPETVALVPFFAGVPRMERPVVAPELPPASDLSPESVLFQLLNRARERAGIPALARNSRLDRVAAKHSADLAERRFFGHVSPTNGGLVRRLASAGLAPRWSAENIAKSTTPLRVHRNLMESPAHRINMLNAVYTHVGIAAVWESGELFCTQIYVDW